MTIQLSLEEKERFFMGIRLHVESQDLSFTRGIMYGLILIVEGIENCMR